MIEQEKRERKGRDREESRTGEDGIKRRKEKTGKESKNVKEDEGAGKNGREREVGRKSSNSIHHLIPFIPQASSVLFLPSSLSSAALFQFTISTFLFSPAWHQGKGERPSEASDLEELTG